MKHKHIYTPLFLPLFLFIFSSSIHAVDIANSNFDLGADGWTWNPIQDPAFSWEPLGGNPGGFIRADDNLDQGGGMDIFAPATFLGDWLGLGVTELSYDSNIFTTGSVFLILNHNVSISGPGGDADWIGPPPDPTTIWKKISVPINEADWTVNSGTWDAILSDVTELRIGMEYYNNFVPFEITGIDNIILISGDQIPITLSIDIKPGSDPNCINNNDQGVIPVAVIGSDSFDVANIDVSSLLFAGLEVQVKSSGTLHCSMEDVNSDGFTDLVCHFADNTANWAPGDEVATLTGMLLDGSEFEGTDTICLVP